MTRGSLFLGCLTAAIVALGAAGCVPTTATTDATSAQPVYGPDPTRDPGGCQAEIAKFVEILDNDVATGRLARDVYQRAKADVAQADTVCAAGRQVQARAILIYTKKNYGYS